MIISAAAQAAIIRRFVQYVEDCDTFGSSFGGAPLSDLLAAEQDYKRTELTDANIVGDRVEIL